MGRRQLCGRVRLPKIPNCGAEAVRLLERANKLSTPATWPPNEMALRFRVSTPDPGYPYEGEYVSSVGGVKIRRREWRYGPFRLTQIRNGTGFFLSDKYTQQPGILHVLIEMTPIYLVHFDVHDIIRSIAEPAEGSRCIEFDTVSGDQQQANEICVDSQKGWLISIRVGDTTTKNSNFFPFNGAFLPAHIERWEGGQKLIETDETVVLKDDYPVDFFKVPENSTGFMCPELRPPYAVNTPQPPPGTSSIDVIDVQLEGLVTSTGKVMALKPVDPTHPELNDEAIKLVSTWTYSPGTCDGKPVGIGMLFTVHFKGR